MLEMSIQSIYSKLIEEFERVLNYIIHLYVSTKVQHKLFRVCKE